jgi:hypothetical protein
MMPEEMVEIQVPAQIRTLFENPETPDALKNILAWIMHYTPDPDALNHRLFGFELGLRFANVDSHWRESLRALALYQESLGIPLGPELDQAAYLAFTTPFRGVIKDANG